MLKYLLKLKYKKRFTVIRRGAVLDFEDEEKTYHGQNQFQESSQKKWPSQNQKDKQDADLRKILKSNEAILKIKMGR